MRKALTVYDPRFGDRTFKSSDGGVWSSAERNVLFFESDDYWSYTSSKFLKKLLTGLALECHVGKVGVRTTDIKVAPLLEWADERCLSRNAVSAVIDLTLFDRLIEVFDKTADYGIWDFYGVPADFRDLDRLKTFPEVLKDVDLLEFVVEVDLDGMLMGFASAEHCDLDRVIQKLEHSYDSKSDPS